MANAYTKVSDLPFMPGKMQLIINEASRFGLIPFMWPGKKSIARFVCPKCKGYMVKFVKPADMRHKIHACRDCGHRHMSKGWIRRWGTFITGTIV